MSDSREWDLPSDRAEVRRQQAAYAKVAQDLAATAAELTRAVYARELAETRLATLQRELDASHRREKALLAELHECKRGGGTTNVTPLRPPRGKP